MSVSVGQLGEAMHEAQLAAAAVFESAGIKVRLLDINAVVGGVELIDVAGSVPLEGEHPTVGAYIFLAASHRESAETAEHLAQEAPPT